MLPRPAETATVYETWLRPPADQAPALQQDAVIEADGERLFTDTASGSRPDRPGLDEALNVLRPCDTLVVWRLDRRGLPESVIDAAVRLDGVATWRRWASRRDRSRPTGTAASSSRGRPPAHRCCWSTDAVRDQWTAEAELRRLNDPYAIPVRSTVFDVITNSVPVTIDVTTA